MSIAMHNVIDDLAPFYEHDGFATRDPFWPWMQLEGGDFHFMAGQENRAVNRADSRMERNVRAVVLDDIWHRIYEEMGGRW